MNIIDLHKHALHELCNQFHVERLYVFGSVLTGSFDKDSDVDFVVKFQPIELAGYFDNYVNFKTKLKLLFNRDVDLLEEQSLKNPILKKSIDAHKQLIYG